MSHDLKVRRATSPSAFTYGIESWGKEYFGISPNGNVTVRDPVHHQDVELTTVVSGLQQRGLDLPVMLRVENLLQHRIELLHQTFADAIRKSQYRGNYRSVFPIKVNQQKHVVNQICRFGQPYAHGLEAGSKAELLIALSELHSPDSLIVCNGYKDREFIDLGLHAAKMGIRCFFVIESLKELSTIIERAKKWNVTPLLGVRLKLTTKVDGHWAGDSGDRSLFGLTATQLVRVVDRLENEGMTQSLQMLHFHLGSQIPRVGNLRDGIAEACRFYVELVREGIPLQYLNLGGGLAVDYDGSHSPTVHSRNYELDEYCIDVVERIMDSLDPAGVEHPCIITESGRWTAAPMSVLLFNIRNVEKFHGEGVVDDHRNSSHRVIERLVDIYDHIEERRLQENLNDVVYYRDLLRRSFQNGKATLRERAMGESLSISILDQIAKMTESMERPAEPLNDVKNMVADIYYGNFSVFQSLPDAWAINQVFPVMPIQRLNEPPTRNGIIADLTCDCDGKLDRFISPEGGFDRTLPLHPLNPNEDYVMGVFLVGAYQETLGDLHNLFGDNHVATVRIGDDGELEFTHELEGDSVGDVLDFVEHDPREMLELFRAKAELAVKERRMTVEDRRTVVNLFQQCLRGSTYLR